MPAAGRVSRDALQRFLAPKSVAVVGASDRTDRYALTALSESSLDVYFVNPTVKTVVGRTAYPDLAAIGTDVDAVYSLVNARRSVEVVEAAAELGLGGVVVQAAGFSEAGDAGVSLERRLVAVVRGSDLPILGPNCNGFINLHTSAYLSGAPRLNAGKGSIGVISHSGGMLLDVANASAGRSVGFSKLISTGNEATTDLVDYLDYLVDDGDTAVICLIVESIRRPSAFFRVAQRAVAIGKPVIALKLGRSDVARHLAATHTGAVVGESWMYDTAFAQHGVISAADVGDLLDRAALFVQIPREKWTPVNGLAVITMSGGAAALCGDICEQEGLVLPDMAAVRASVTEHVPRATVFNPVDLTGFSRGRSDVVEAIVRAYLHAPSTDAILMVWTLSALAGRFGLSVAEPFVGVATEAGIPMLLADAGDTQVGEWAATYVEQGVGVVSGVRPALRGLAAMAQFMTARRERRPHRSRIRAPSPPADSACVLTPRGRMLRFGATMRLLARAGIPAVPYLHVDADEPVDDIQVPFDGNLVVKLADVPHRSDVGGVRLGVRPREVPEVVRDLRALAGTRALPRDVVVQPLADGAAEIFVGADTTAELGTLVVCGLGGIYVELLKRFSARLSPLGTEDPEDMLRASGVHEVLRGFRGGEAWDMNAVVSTILGVDDLAQAEWVSSIDLNPIMLTGNGPAAVDALIMVKDAERVAD